MSVLDTTTHFPFRSLEDDAEDAATIDLRGEVIDFGDRRSGTTDEPSEPSEPREPTAPAPTTLPEGIRVRGVRIGSLAKIAAVFFGVGHLAVLGTLVACWNVLQQFGFVADVENMAVTSLGLERFVIDGQSLFELAVVVTGVIAALGFVVTMLLALVYNAACGLLGGVAVEVAPLRRAKRVFSPRHGRFVSIV